MKKWLLIVLMSLCSFAATADEYIESAMTWLNLVDQGDYAQSWQYTDAFFQENVTEQQWVSKLNEVRTSLGAVESRTLHEQKAFSALEQMPEGEYVLLQFKTNFAKRIHSMESITLKQEPEGWQVIGYFIQ